MATELECAEDVVIPAYCTDINGGSAKLEASLQTPENCS